MALRRYHCSSLVHYTQYISCCMFISLMDWFLLKQGFLFLCTHVYPSTVLCHKLDTQRMNSQQQKKYYPKSILLLYFPILTCPISRISLTTSNQVTHNSRFCQFYVRNGSSPWFFATSTSTA